MSLDTCFNFFPAANVGYKLFLMTYIFCLTTEYHRIEDITSLQFPVFQETGLSAGDLLVLPDDCCSEELNIFFAQYPPCCSYRDRQLPWCAESQILLRPSPACCSRAGSHCSWARRYDLNIFGQYYYYYMLTKGTDNVTSIIERFADAGFTVPEVIALLVSHTIAAAVRSQLFACFYYQH